MGCTKILVNNLKITVILLLRTENLMNRPTSNLFPFVNVFITTSTLVQSSFSTITPSHNLWSICPLCAVVPLWSIVHIPWCYKSSSPLRLVDIKLRIQKCLLDHPDHS